MRLFLGSFAVLVLAIGCGGGSSPAAQALSGTFHGVGDPSRGMLQWQGVDRAGFRSRSVVTVSRDGVPGSGPADTVELVTESTGDGADGCGRLNAFCGQVTVRNLFDTESLRGVCVRISAISNVANAAFGGRGVTQGIGAAYGLWCYGNLAPGASATQTWKFENPAGLPFSFTGEVLAEIAPAEAAVENCAIAGDDDGDGLADCADPDCVADFVCNTEACGNGVADVAGGAVDCDNPACAGNAACPAVFESCNELRSAGYTVDGQYYIDPGSQGAIQAYCDMTTDGGGWTILYAATGADGEEPIVSDTTRDGNPLLFEHYGVSRADKVRVSNTGLETLFLRDSGVWLKANRAPFDSTMLLADQHQHYAVTIQANSGEMAPAFMGWTNYQYAAGGDYYVTKSPDGVTGGGMTTMGVDHHDGHYWHTNWACVYHYLYSMSWGPIDDWDAGYDGTETLGDWTHTESCHLEEGGTMVFRMAVR